MHHKNVLVPPVNIVPPQIPMTRTIVYTQNIYTVLTQIFTNVKSFTAGSNLAVNKDNLVNKFIFDDMYSPCP